MSYPPGTPIRMVQTEAGPVEIPDWDIIQRSEIAVLEKLGERIGYGRCMQILQEAWAKKLREDPEYALDSVQADLGAGTICVWCHTDKRTGKVVKIPSRSKPRKVRT